jgi:hypothetical protein
MSDRGESPFKYLGASPAPESGARGFAAGVVLSLVLMVLGSTFAFGSNPRGTGSMMTRGTAGTLLAVLAGPAVLIVVGTLIGRRDFVLGTAAAVAFVLVVFGGCIAAYSGTGGTWV